MHSGTRLLLRRLSLRRVWNVVKVYASYQFSKWSRKPIQWGMPISISIEPTTSCNLRCPECPSGLRSFSRPTGMLEEAFFRKTIDELYPDLIYLTFYFQGEPYLNPRFLDLVRYAHSRHIFTSTSTNAHYLDEAAAKATVESGLDRLLISLDGTTQETYASYRIGGELSKVLEGTRRLVKWKKALNSSTPILIFQFLVVKPNEHQLQDVQQLALELGVDEVKFKTAQIYDYKNGNKLIPDNNRYSRYRPKKDGTWELKNRLENHCWKLWQSPVITWDGVVVPCCFDKDAQHAMGDLKNTSFRELWQGKEYRTFRSSVLKSRSEIDICTNCSEGTKVWA
ncbi:MAG TPA: SPASM domain-containing protein [Bacteroidia bacterium]|jgi:radical SAM protein with 4Fe4S-binding SPASM domain|nr:SPASM domain-containing protein [Bacteroidia bacterium]